MDFSGPECGLAGLRERAIFHDNLAEPFQGDIHIPPFIFNLANLQAQAGDNAGVLRQRFHLADLLMGRLYRPHLLHQLDASQLGLHPLSFVGCAFGEIFQVLEGRRKILLGHCQIVELVVNRCPLGVVGGSLGSCFVGPDRQLSFLASYSQVPAEHKYLSQQNSRRAFSFKNGG